MSTRMPVRLIRFKCLLRSTDECPPEQKQAIVEAEVQLILGVALTSQRRISSTSALPSPKWACCLTAEGRRSNVARGQMEPSAARSGT